MLVPRPIALLPGLLAALALCLLPPSAFGQRSEPAQRLPHDTLAYLHVASLGDLVERAKQTGWGRIAQDPQMKPFVEHLTGLANTRLAGEDQQRDMQLSDLGAAFRGELVLALVPREERGVAVVLMLQQPDNPAALDKLLKQAEEGLVQAGATRTEEQAGGAALTIFERPGNRPDLVYFIKDRTLVVTAGKPIALDLLEHWDGRGQESFATSAGYAAITRSPFGGETEKPQALLFLDPIAIARAAGSRNAQATIALALLPALGLDGVQAIGGRLWLATEGFDQLVQLDVLLDNPRSGALQVLALRPVDPAPPRWAPGDLADYSAWEWNVQQSYGNLVRLLGTFQQEGTFKAMVESRVEGPLKVDFEKDLIEAVQGRFVYLTRYEQPARIDSRAAALAVKLKDAAAFEPTAENIAAHAGPVPLERKDFRGVTCYQQPEDADDDAAGRAAPAFCFALLDDWLVLADRPSMLHALISTKEGAIEPLSESLDYKLVASRVKRQAGSTAPAALLFNRREEMLRHLYGLVGDGSLRKQLNEQRNPLAGTVDGLLDAAELPPLEVLTRYIAPSGGAVIDDETGLHYIGFTLRRK